MRGFMRTKTYLDQNLKYVRAKQSKIKQFEELSITEQSGFNS